MGTFTEIHTCYRRNGSRAAELLVYEQPLRHWLAWKLYHGVWEKLTGNAMMKAEGFFRRRHEKRCGTGCVMGTRMSTGEQEPMCGYIPLSNRQDMRCYDLGQRGRHSHFWLKLIDDEAVTLGWKP